MSQVTILCKICNEQASRYCTFLEGPLCRKHPEICSCSAHSLKRRRNENAAEPDVRSRRGGYDKKQERLWEWVEWAHSYVADWVSTTFPEGDERVVASAVLSLVSEQSVEPAPASNPVSTAAASGSGDSRDMPPTPASDSVSGQLHTSAEDLAAVFPLPLQEVMEKKLDFQHDVVFAAKQGKTDRIPARPKTLKTRRGSVLEQIGAPVRDRKSKIGVPPLCNSSEWSPPKKEGGEHQAMWEDRSPYLMVSKSKSIAIVCFWSSS
jgi:hypothetical protein